ncbi:hypothetical protein AMC79_CH02414 [Rhizobium phaseoli]|nr:hypothetical protein AMC89_CH02421 [Rhizobium phaseoli]ANL98198.1 hypothetical protein AMC79_CH02414 [Rhizobium phaseoli]
MRDSFLREPQVELFFQAYLIGLPLGHLPFFFSDLGLGLLFAKFFLSLPIVFLLFIFYRIKYAAVNSRPFLWGEIILIVSAPSLLATCIYFPVMIRLRLRRSVG